MRIIRAMIAVIISCNIIIYSIHYFSIDPIEYKNKPIATLDKLFVRRNQSNQVDSWFQTVIKKGRSKNITSKVNEIILPPPRLDVSANYIVEPHTEVVVEMPSKPNNQATKDTSDSAPLVVKYDNLKSSKLHAVTYASHGGRDDRFCRAVESAIRHGFHLIILGWGVKWEGLSQKLDAAHKFALSLPPDDVILFTDAFDVMFANSPEHVLSTFLGFKHDLVFGAECGCWPHVMENRTACFTGYPASPTPYRYLNSGTWIGRAMPAAAMLQSVIKGAGANFANANDQKLVADMYINHTFDIKLDFYSSLFQSMHMTLDPPLPRCNPNEDMTVTSSGHWVNKRTKSEPAVFHFNGGGKMHHLGMERRMWYKEARHNTREKIAELGNFELTVPTQKTGKMRFADLCKEYMSMK